MDPRNYARLAAIIFVVIALVQLLRVLFAWEITLNGARSFVCERDRLFSCGYDGVAWIWRVAQVVAKAGEG